MLLLLLLLLLLLQQHELQQQTHRSGRYNRLALFALRPGTAASKSEGDTQTLNPKP